MKNVACLLFAVCAVGGCVASTDDVEDGRDDSFLGADGKADTGSIVEGSSDALAVLQVANERSADEMHNHGVPKRAAQNIVAVRVGDDGIAGTSDDVTFTTLAQLDAVPYVGPQAFARLLAYADELASAMPTSTPLTPPADMWHVASCSPIAWTQLVALFPAGQTTYDFHRPYATTARYRETCNAITGCTSWRDGGWLYVRDDSPAYKLHPVEVPSAARGSISMSLSTTSTGIGFSAVPSRDSTIEDYRFECDVTSQQGASDPLTCRISGVDRWAYEGAASFTNNEWNNLQAEMHGHVCADGSFHFTTEVLDDDSNSLQNRVQVALYGQLF